MSHSIVSTTPILFSQTREDPTVEINTISDGPSSQSICLIASGGDTCCSILASASANKISKIDVIDPNVNQIYLTKLKLALFKNYPGDLVCKLLTNNYNGTSYANDSFVNDNNVYYRLLLYLFDNNLIDDDTYGYWMKHIDLLVRGVNRSGRFELLFKTVMINEDFENNFSHENLTTIFGENATKYSINKSFPEHFAGILSTYRKLYPDPDSNYFYHQFIHDSYGTDLPLYLQTTDPPVVNCEINFYQTSMLDHLKKIPDNQDDLIHLSNSTDWLNPKIFCTLLDEVGRTLKLNGKSVLRRLNSDTKIEDYISTFYATNGKYKFDIRSGIFDKSHFYSEVLVITKIDLSDPLSK